MPTNGLSLTFYDLISEYQIVIPKIQRDYVQGRDNKTIGDNREEFVEELFSSLHQKTPMSLNFVYGSIGEGGEFIPIDGQQRLTTLFLLHLYVFAKDKNHSDINFLLKNFSYQTRYTTNRFFKKLGCELPAILENKNKGESLKENIEHSGWFISSFIEDPNVQSALVMLNLIDTKYDSLNGGVYSLSLKENCPITFMWLRVDKSFGSDNRLYIRMNSRGKQLTNFESFKAELYEKALNVKGDNLNEVKSFKENIDGSWYSWLWEMKLLSVDDNKLLSNEVKAKLIDQILRLTFHWITINFILCAQKKGTEEDKEKLFQLLSPSCDVDNVFVYDYLSLCKTYKLELIESIKQFISVFSFLTSIPFKENKDKVLACLIENIFKISFEKKRRRRRPVYAINSYSSRILLYAVTHFAVSNLNHDLEAFKSYFRVILNLVDAQEIDRPSVLESGIKSISFCDLNCGKNIASILEDWLKKLKDEKKHPFRTSQVKEEILKLRLLSEQSWKKEILDAEKLDFDSPYENRDYFRGQIGFLLNMSKEETDDYDLKSFIYYRNAVRCIFDKDNYWDGYAKDDIKIDRTTIDAEVEPEDCSFDNLFHRALLVSDDYLADSPSNGVKTYFVYNEKHHNYDWRGAFRQKNDNTYNNAVTCLKKLLDTYHIEPGNEFSLSDRSLSFKQFKDWTIRFLKKQCNKNAEDNNIEKNLRYFLINKARYFQYIHRNYYVYINGDNYELMMLKRRRRDATILLTFAQKNLSSSF